MKHILLVSSLFLLMFACNGSVEGENPEPHLVVGQRLTFLGADPDNTYVIAGYRQQLEDKTKTSWSKKMQYIVFTYFNEQGDYKQGVVHVNAVQKR